MLIHLVPLIRLVVDRNTPRRWSAAWGFIKLSALYISRPAHSKPIRLFGELVHHGRIRFLWSIYAEVFVARLYARFAPLDAKRIIDAGAHIGLAAMLYRQIYPEAEVMCFEPDPGTFALLKRNLGSFTGVTLHQAALSDVDGTTVLYIDEGAVGDPGSSNSRELRSAVDSEVDLVATPVRSVSAERLAEHPVDILKLDIEGGEGAVLRSFGDRLSSVRHIEMEHHPLVENRFDEALALLQAAGHHYRIEKRQPIAPPIANVAGSVAMVYSSLRSRG